MNQRKDLITNVGAVIVVITVAFLVARKDLSDSNRRQKQRSSPLIAEDKTLPSPSAAPFTVWHTEEGFAPTTLYVQRGSAVAFQNKSKRAAWPASDPHPTHTAYPESGICAGRAFDSCKPINIGEQWIFIFNIAGTWKYHNHLQPNEIGVIIVE